MMSILWSLAAFIVALGILITVHEFGHFWVARRCGVRVERFSIGFGKALWRRTDRQGTEYVIALIPLGGYVKMLDERVEAVAPELRHQSFNNKLFYNVRQSSARVLLLTSFCHRRLLAGVYHRRAKCPSGHW